jgi:hypothetical protein
MATPKTSRAPAPTKPKRIHSPILRVGVGRRELPEKGPSDGTPLGSFQSAKTLVQRQRAASLIINNFFYLDALRDCKTQNFPLPTTRSPQKQAIQGVFDRDSTIQGSYASKSI